MVSEAEPEQATFASPVAVSFPVNSVSSNSIDWSLYESSATVATTLDADEESSAGVAIEETPESTSGLVLSDIGEQVNAEPIDSNNSTLELLEESMLTSEV